MSRTSLSVRLDIDTVECVKGLPAILSLAERRGVHLTFYANLGKSVARYRSLRDALFGNGKGAGDKVQKIPARKKQALPSLVHTLCCNPSLFRDQPRNWALLKASTHEVGLHGGRNHAIWQRDALDWSAIKVEEEVEWGIEAFVTVFGRRPSSFASPGWSSPHALASVLTAQGFQYYADRNIVGERQACQARASIPNVNTNILGEPGHVGFFEHCFSRGLDDKAMLSEFDSLLLEGEHNVMYDHPGFTSLLGLGYLRALISHTRKRRIEIMPVCAALDE